MIQPIQIPRDEFPKSPSKAEGMITLNIKCDNDELTGIRDIEYIDRDEIKLTIQLILPTKREKKIPLICYITGSAFHWQDIPSALPRLTYLANRGIGIASIQYRASDVAPFPAQVLDIKAGIRFLKEHADEYSFDREQFFTMGESSGGNVSLMSGLTTGIELFEEDIYRSYSSEVKGVIDFYGPTDITRMNDELSTQNHMEPDSPEGYLIGRKNVAENPRLAEPTIVMNYVTMGREIPPVLICHGTNDELVPFGQSCMLYEKLKECGKKAVFYAIEGAHHGGSEFWSNRMLDIIEKFVKTGEME